MGPLNNEKIKQSIKDDQSILIGYLDDLMGDFLNNKIDSMTSNVFTYFENHVKYVLAYPNYSPENKITVLTPVIKKVGNNTELLKTARGVHLRYLIEQSIKKLSTPISAGTFEDCDQFGTPSYKDLLNAFLVDNIHLAQKEQKQIFYDASTEENDSSDNKSESSSPEDDNSDNWSVSSMCSSLCSEEIKLTDSRKRPRDGSNDVQSPAKRTKFFEKQKNKPHNSTRRDRNSHFACHPSL